MGSLRKNINRKDLAAEVEKALINDRLAQARAIYTVESVTELEYLAEEAPPRRICGNFWFEGELCLLFAKQNRGKSVFAVQIADAITKGKTCGGLANEMPAQPVLYFDYELTKKQFANRYVDERDRSIQYKFAKSFLRPTITYPKVRSAKDAAELILEGLRETLKDYPNIRIIIIDNITRIGGDLTEGKAAFDIMCYLDELKKEGYSILVLGHAKKGGDTDKFGISAEDSIGSSMIQNFIDSSFAIGKNSENKATRYLKQTKVRACEESEDVAIFEQVKENGFLHFKYAGTDSENNQLKVLQDDERESRDGIIWEFYQRDPSRSLRSIAAEINDGKTFKTKVYPETVKRVIAKIQADQAEKLQVWNDAKPDTTETDTPDEQEQIPF